MPSYRSVCKPNRAIAWADFTTDLVKNNSSIEGLMLDTGSSLKLCFGAREMDSRMLKAAVQQELLTLKTRLKKRLNITPYQ